MDYELGYARLVQRVLDEGTPRGGRNGVTQAIFGATLELEHYPGQLLLLRGRKMFYKGVLGELAAFLKGPKHLDDFTKEGCNYWGQWAREDGSLTLDYGNAWLDFNGVNQLEELIEKLKSNPTDRRLIISGWRPDRLAELSLPCCHLLYQWYVVDGKLHMIWYQRSVDMMLGLPSDVILAQVWNHLIANEVGLKPGKIIMMLADTHIYIQHKDNAKKYVEAAFKVKDSYPTYNLYGMTTKNFDAARVTVEGYIHAEKIDFELVA